MPHQSASSLSTSEELQPTYQDHCTLMQQSFLQFKRLFSSSDEKMTGPTDGVYVIRNVSSKTVLDVGTSTNPFPRLTCYQYSFDNIDRQLFDVKQVDSDQFVIIDHHTRRVLDLEGSNGNDGARIITYPVHWGKNQVWKITSQRYATSSRPGHCLRSSFPVPHLC